MKGKCYNVPKTCVGQSVLRMSLLAGSSGGSQSSSGSEDSGNARQLFTWDRMMTVDAFD